MAGMNVPELARKLNLLVETGIFADRAALAKMFDRSEITLRGWANGGSGTPPDTVPQKNVSTLIGLYEKALPNLSYTDVCSVLAGPASDLENLLKPGSERSLKELIAREADKSSASLFIDDQTSMGLVRRAARSQPAPQFKVKREQPFRLEFATASRASFVIAIQCAPGGWAVVSSSLDRSIGRVHVLGADPDGSLPFMIEDNELGQHIFVMAQAARAFPAELHLAEQDGVPLDRTLLAHFIRHFEAQDRSSRRLFAVDIEMTK